MAAPTKKVLPLPSGDDDDDDVKTTTDKNPRASQLLMDFAMHQTQKQILSMATTHIKSKLRVVQLGTQLEAVEWFKAMKEALELLAESVSLVDNVDSSIASLRDLVAVEKPKLKCNLFLSPVFHQNSVAKELTDAGCKDQHIVFSYSGAPIGKTESTLRSVFKIASSLLCRQGWLVLFQLNADLIQQRSTTWHCCHVSGVFELIPGLVGVRFANPSSKRPPFYPHGWRSNERVYSTGTPFLLGFARDNPDVPRFGYDYKFEEDIGYLTHREDLQSLAKDYDMSLVRATTVTDLAKGWKDVDPSKFTNTTTPLASQDDEDLLHEALKYWSIYIFEKL